MTMRHRKVLEAVLDRVSEPGAIRAMMFEAHEFQRWPAGSVEALTSVKLFKDLPLAETITCLACEERCRRPVTICSGTDAADEKAIWLCHLRDDMSYFERGLHALRQYSSSRKMVAEFVGKQLRVKPKDWDENWRRVRYETLQSNDVQRSLSLEFSDDAVLKLGGATIPLVDLIDWG